MTTKQTNNRRGEGMKKIKSNITIEVKKIKIENNYLLATSPDLPGFYVQAKTQKELEREVNGAILSYFDILVHYKEPK